MPFVVCKKAKRGIKANREINFLSLVMTEQGMTDVFFDALIDTLKLFPFLVLIYIIIELLEHKTNMSSEHSRLRGGLGPLIGSATGLIPQCGFSVMAAKLYEQKYITIGTLLAIFLSTSDEAFVILISEGAADKLLPLIIVKMAIGVCVGYIADGISFLWQKRAMQPLLADGAFIDKDSSTNPMPGAGDVHSLFFKNDEKEECTSCGREHDEGKPWMTYFLHPLLHSLQVAAFIFIVNFVLGAIIYAVTEEKFIEFMQKGALAQPFITALIGLIPNCASSVVITQCFMKGGILFGSCVAGLCSNAGLGFVVLLKNTKKWKRNLALILICYAVSVLCGMLINAVWSW